MTPSCRPTTAVKEKPSVAASEAFAWQLDEADVAELSVWFDNQLEALEHQYRSFSTRESLMSGISR